MSREQIRLEPVGEVSTPFERPADAPRQGAERDVAGTIRVDPPFERGLAGIEAGDETVVIWFADRSDEDLLTLASGRGVFASRSQDRPNPICVTRCAVEDRHRASLRVRGVDMLDGTPVLDLKSPGIGHDGE